MNSEKDLYEEVSTVFFPHKVFRGLVLALVVSAFAISSGCSTTGMRAEDRTSRDWYEEGLRLMGKKRYQGATEAFLEAANLYRDAALDADIHMSLGDAYYGDKKFEEAVEAYREFLRVHPRNHRSDRAQYRIGMCYFRQMRGEDRSQEPTKRALEAFERVVRNYPRSEWVGEAREKIVLCRRRLAEHELYVGRYYMRTKSYEAALPRFDRVYRDYQDLGYGDDALYYLGLCYQKQDKIEKAREFWDLLIRDYPHSRYREEVTDEEG